MRNVWFLIAIITIVDTVWLPIAHMSVEPQPLALVLAACAGLLALKTIYTKRRPEPRLAALAESAAIMIAYTAAAGVLSYLMVTLRMPLLDEWLVSADRTLGLDWLALNEWIRGFPTFFTALVLAYGSLIPQMIFLLLFFNYRGQIARCYELVWLFVITSISCVLLSGPLPTAGAFAYFQTSINEPYVQIFVALRDGTMKIINLQQVEGVVQFPSLHLALALCCAYVARGVKVIFPIFAILNAFVIIATPFVGGHHFADLWGGAFLTVAAIFAVKKGAFLKDQHKQGIMQPLTHC